MAASQEQITPNPSTGVHDPLLATALALEAGQSLGWEEMDAPLDAGNRIRTDAPV